MPPTEQNGSNRTLERAAAILDAVGRSAVSASELSRRTGREIRIEADHSLAFEASHAQIVPR